MTDAIDEPLCLHPTGLWDATIVEIGELKQAHNPGTWLLPIKLETDVNKNLYSCSNYVYVFLAGYFPAVRWILMFKDAYIGCKVRIKIKHVQREDRMYMSTEIRDRLI